MLAADPWVIVGGVAGLLAVLAALTLGIPTLKGTSLAKTNEILDTALGQERREREELEKRVQKERDDLAARLSVEREELSNRVQLERQQTEDRCQQKIEAANGKIAMLEGRLDAITGDFAVALAERIVAATRGDAQ